MIWVVSLLLVASGLVDLFVGLWILATAVFVLVVQLASWRRGQLVLLVLLVVVLCAAAVLRRNEARDVPRSPSPASSDLSPWPRHPASRCGSQESLPPSSLRSTEWSTYRCKQRRDARRSWHRCLPRPSYSTVPGTGCPGAERCCPPQE
ncbi:MAG: hypothetical protein KC464_31385 [Myxococcales bacterium]|nr:hypothetical protein [Myxococcales bacterium]